MNKSWRGRRLIACRTRDMFHEVIDNLGVVSEKYPDPIPDAPNAAMKQELKNQVTSLLRMILILNDGHVSPQELRGH